MAFTACYLQIFGENSFNNSLFEVIVPENMYILTAPGIMERHLVSKGLKEKSDFLQNNLVIATPHSLHLARKSSGYCIQNPMGFDKWKILK